MLRKILVNELHKQDIKVNKGVLAVLVKEFSEHVYALEIRSMDEKMEFATEYVNTYMILGR